MRGAIRGWSFLFIVLVMAGARAFADGGAAFSCEHLFTPTLSGSEDSTRIQSGFAKFEDRWHLAPEFSEGLRAIATWAPPSMLVEVTNGLLKQRQYRRRLPQDQLQILFVVLQLRIRAGLADVELSQKLLENTAARIVSGRVRLRIDRNILLAHWSRESMVLNPGMVFDVSKPIVRGDPNEFALMQSLGAIAHEMSHSLSRPKVEGKIGYLIEEYRAYQVGFLAQNGYWPSKADSVLSLLQLLFNPWRLESYEILADVFMRRWKTEPYRRLFAELSLDIEKVANELRAFRTAEFVARTEPLSNEDIDQMRSMLKAKLIRHKSYFEPAPKFGWTGFEQNLSKRSRVAASDRK